MSGRKSKASQHVHLSPRQLSKQPSPPPAPKRKSVHASPATSKKSRPGGASARARAPLEYHELDGDGDSDEDDDAYAPSEASEPYSRTALSDDDPDDDDEDDDDDELREERGATGGGEAIEEESDEEEVDGLPKDPSLKQLMVLLLQDNRKARVQQRKEHKDLIALIQASQASRLPAHAQQRMRQRMRRRGGARGSDDEAELSLPLVRRARPPGASAHARA
jgi:hypothetical protein